MLSLFSPAKINVFLRVVGRREDGYHELSTFMQTIDLGDIVSLSVSPFDILTCSGSDIPCDPSNLAWKALCLFRQTTGCLTPVNIHLEKKIPSQAGLGGGSSNAATVLWGLNQLFGTALSDVTLQKISVVLGADVPFFFSMGAAHCVGIGDQVEPRPMVTETFFLHKPRMGLATKEVFSAFDLKMASHRDELFVNDLELVAMKRCVELKRLKETLMPYYKTIFMTGSGTALIAHGGAHPEGIPIRPISRQQQGWYTAI